MSLFLAPLPQHREGQGGLIGIIRRRLRSGSSSWSSIDIELDVEAETAHFLDQHVEAFRNAGLEGVVALDDRLIDLGPADHVIRLHRQHFLQRVGGAIGLQRPHLHFAEALAAELRLAAQRLLGDEAVRPDRARVDLVVDQDGEA